MKTLEYLTSFLIFLYTCQSLAVKVVYTDDFDNILQHYGYGHHVYGDGEAEAARQADELSNCDIRNDPWGGKFLRVGGWGPDTRRPLEVDERSLPKELRLTSDEKRQLAATGAILCTDDDFNNTDGTGFIIDIDSLGASADRKYEIIATASHVLYNSETGEQRRCEFYSDSNNLKEYYVITPEACGSTRADSISNGVNDKDWCFARIGTKISGRYGKIEVDFSDKFDWSEQERDKSQFISGGWRADKQRVDFSLNCSPDDKSKYPNLLAAGKRYNRDYSRLVIGDCYEDPGTSGGPFIQRQGNRIKAFALIMGDISEIDRGDYDPDEARGNLYTKFTKEMEKKLKEVIRSLDAISI